jgi:hypothetical protein
MVNSAREPEVRLHESRDRDGPSPVADQPGRRVDGRLDMLGPDMAAVDVVEVAVPCLCADGRQPLQGKLVT